MKIFKGGKQDLVNTLKDMLEGNYYGVDTETTGLCPHTNHIRLVQIATSKEVVVIDTYAYDRPWVIKVLKRFFEATGNKPKIFANAKFDLKFFIREGIDNIKEVHDVLMMFKVKYAGECSQFPNLVEVINFCFDKQLSLKDKKDKQKEDWSQELTDDQYEYAGNDTLYLPALYEHLKRELLEEGKLWHVYNNVELPCLHSVVGMEYRGVPVDPEVFVKLYDMLTPIQEQARKDLLEFFHEHGSVIENLNSWQQVLKAFLCIGIELPNTQESTLQECEHPIAGELLAYKKRKTLLQFVNSLPTFIVPATGRLHGQFHQLGTNTGRFTASKPCLQQLPRPIYGEDIVLRSFVKASEGFSLVCADYSQLELVIAAEITQDRLMLETYRSGGDIHKLTASLILDKPIEEVTKEDRQIAKAVNFGLIYGMGAAKLVIYAKTSYRVIMSLEQATEYRNRFFDTYSGLRDWHNRANWEIKSGASTTTTLGGRIRKFSRVRGSHNELKFTAYLNTQDQGTGGDIIKIAMAVLHKRLPQARLILQVHDELVYEVPEDQAEFCRGHIEKIMSMAGKVLIPSVPVAVEAKIGKTWNEAK